MIEKQRLASVGVGFGGALAALAVFAVPVLAQQGGGGREASFTLRQGFETQRNPELDPDAENDRRSLATTDLDYTLSTTTRRASVSLSLGAQLLGATGDLDVGEEEGFEIDRPRVALRHRYLAPNAEFITAASVQRFDIGFLEPLDLIQNPDGTVSVPDDLDDLEGTGFRTNTILRFDARFGLNDPFGWGVFLRDSTLRYEDVSGSDLEDSRRTDTGINARFDLTEVLSLQTGIRYELRNNESEDAQDTLFYDLALSRTHANNGVLRAGVSLAQPEDREDRFTVFFGGSQRIDGVRDVDFNIGTTIGEGGDSRLVGLIDYRQSLSRTLDVTLGFNRQASDTRDNETVLDTAASFGLLQALTPVSGVSFGVLYGERENFTTDDLTTDVSVTVQYSYDLTRDWAFSAGASHIWSNDSDTDLTTSDQLFFSIGRSWNSRF